GHPHRGRRLWRHPDDAPVTRARRPRPPPRERGAYPRIHPPPVGPRHRPRDPDERQEGHAHLRREGLRRQGRQVARRRPLPGRWRAWRGALYSRAMPIYEYRCGACGKKVTVLTLRVSETVSPTCEHCGSHQLTRLMSRFAMLRSADARLDGLGDDAGGLDENDPKSVARWMRKMGKELGDDAGDDF